MTTPTPDPMREAMALIEIVEGIAGAMKHGTWRDENGMRLKDTPEWVAFYNATKDHAPLAAAPQPAPAPDERAAMTPDEFMDFTRPLPDRPYDEQYDNQGDVERDPCGAWVAIQHMSHHLAAAPQPADGDFVSDECDTKDWPDPRDKQPSPADRDALSRFIFDAADYMPVHMSRTIADALLAAGWRRADQAAQGDYAQGYSDAEAEISKTALGDKVASLSEQNMALRKYIKELKAERYAAYRKGQEDMRDFIADWIEPQRSETPANGWEFTPAIRALPIQGGDDAA